MADRRGSRAQDAVRGASAFYGSGYRTWNAAKRQGMPRWAWWGAVADVGLLGAITVYLASRSLLAAAVIGGVSGSRP